jgi:hypothetical protein
MSDDRSATADVLAAELVLGLLSRDEQAIAAARLASDARFAAEVAAWEEHFGALAWQVEDQLPPREVWTRIAVAIDARKASQSRWPRASMAMAGAAALLMLTVLVWPSPEARRAPNLAVATLVGPDLVVGARYAAKSGRMRVEIAGAVPGPGTLDPAPRHGAGFARPACTARTFGNGHAARAQAAGSERQRVRDHDRGTFDEAAPPAQRTATRARRDNFYLAGASARRAIP